jgi:hypothetical protein
MITAGLLLTAPASAGQKPKEWNPLIEPANFVSAVDNPYFPLLPGSTREYSGTTRSGTETFRIEVTHQQKTILGVSTTVVIETAAINGEVVEIAENWFAQDREGNVWYFGESTQEFDHGKPGSTAGSWEAGVNDAKPGIIMRAHPNGGDTYFQEFAPDVAQDMATVIGTDRTVSILFGTYANVLLTKEWTPLEPSSVEHKFYAPGIGLILEEKGAERLVLIAAQ